MITASAGGSVGVRLVVVRDDQIEAELARAAAPPPRANAAIDRHDDARAGGVQPIDRRRLQSVAVAQAIRNEVHDFAAEHFDRAAQDHGGRHAVDVVVAVDGDALASRDGAEQPIDGRAHVREQKRVVQLVESG